MPQTKTQASKAVKTAFGIVDRRALEKLHGSYDTFVLGDAVDAIHQECYRDEELREGVMALHGIAMNLINDNYIIGELEYAGSFWGHLFCQTVPFSVELCLIVTKKRTSQTIWY